MDGTDFGKYLEVPKVRKSFGVLKDIKRLTSNNTITPISSPIATSTVERQVYDSLTDPHLRLYYNKSSQKETCDSSLGLLDIENCQELNDDSITRLSNHFIKNGEDLKSLSFNAQEMSGRSTSNLSPLKDDCKENENPLKSTINEFKPIPTADIDEIIQRAKRQSIAVDEILKTASDQVVSKKQSLESYSHSLKNLKKTITKSNFCHDEQNYSDVSEISQSVCDSSKEGFFPEKKVDMSMAELSWIKEKGEIPVSIQQNNTFDGNSISDFVNRNQRSDFSYVLSDSKLSMDNYFKKGCMDIKDFLQAKSPEKQSCTYKGLYELEKSKTTDNLSHNTHKKSSFELNSLKNKVKDNEELKILKPKNTAQESLSETNTDDTIGPFSLTQIRNIVGNLNAERPSVIIDNMLGIGSKKNNKAAERKSIVNKVELLKTESNEATFQSPLANKDTWTDITNMFHSTKYANNLEGGNEKASTNHGSRIQDNFMKLSPITEHKFDFHDGKKLDSNSSKVSRKSQSNSISSLQNTLKNTKISTIDSNTNSLSTTKSGVTVIPGKHSNYLNLIEESPTSGFENMKLSSINEIKKDGYLDMSPGIRSISNDKASQSQIILTPSDVTNREIKDLMSPMSSNDNEPVIQTPPSGRHVKRLIDHYQRMNSYDESDNVWISPTKTKINDASKDCIPSVTPLRLEQIKRISSTIEKVSNGDKINGSYLKTSLNENTGKDDWIKVQSINESVVVGMTHDLKLNMKSLSSGWLSVNFAVNKVFIDGELYTDDIRNIVLLQAPKAKILLKSDSNVECFLKLMCLIVNPNIKIQLNIIMADIVTQESCTLEHCIEVQSILPRLYLQDLEANVIDSLEFPTVPEECDHCFSAILWNDSNSDLPLKISLHENLFNAYKIINIENILEDDIPNQIQPTTEMKSSDYSLPTADDVFSLPSNKKSALLIMVYFCPILTDGDKIKHMNAILNVSVVAPSNYHTTPISVCNYPICGTVGISSLLVRNNQKSDVLYVQQGTTENLEMLNNGSITMHYKLYFAMNTDKEASELKLIPCKKDFFILDKMDLYLQPEEKTVIKITHPTNSTIPDSVKRYLVFESPYTTEIIDIIGSSIQSRCPSQQSIFSVESTSELNEVMIKSSRKELSWGSIKVGESKIQDITFKNISYNKKLRVLVALNGEGFKVLSDNGPVSSLAFTLQPQECRALHVEFKPAHNGGHSGHFKIVRRTNGEDAHKSTTLFKAPMHGFGGESILIFRDGVFRHAGAQGLPLGSFNDSAQVKEIYFTIWNKGTAAGFVLFNIELKWKYRSLGSDVFITPSQAVIQPGDAMKCTVTIPRRAAALARGQYGDTETVANLVVFHGDESNRLRIKKIRNSSKSEDTIWQDLSHGKLERLCSKFSNEDLKYGNVFNFKENAGALKNLLDELQQKEVVITYDLNLDYSIAHLSNDLDETLKFYSIHEDDSTDMTLMQ